MRVARTRGGGTAGHRATPRRHPRSESDRPRVDRPLREDLLTQASLEAYGAIRHEGRLADRALDQVLRAKRHLYSNERRAVAERVYALLRRQRTVDALLTRTAPGFERRATSEQDQLRLGASRVLHGEEAARVARAIGLRPADTQLLEGLPRAISALRALPLAERFAIEASLPDFLAERFRREFGQRAEAEVAAMNERAPLTARVNGLRMDRAALASRLRAEGVAVRETPLSPLGLFLETRLNAFALPSFREGLFELQDEGSQLLGMLVDAPPTRVVDACAGAGGKTLQLAAQMKNRGELFALDIDARRLEALKLRARRAGVHNVRIRTLPSAGSEASEALADLVARADRVLVDAPCTGTGTFRRKPDARYRLTEQRLADHVAQQRDLLEQFAPLVKPGGRLVYGTCSLLREENEEVVEAFLRQHPEFSVLPPGDRLGAELGERVTQHGFLRLSPAQHGTDGFFGAILLRRR
jgi:16S rRNA (cytosine967-C5)-methyltransferase